VSRLLRYRKLIAVVCLAAIFVAVVTPASWGALCGVLVVLDPLFGIVISDPALADGRLSVPLHPFSDSIDSRGPPALSARENLAA
jgi:hypothetical protein